MQKTACTILKLAFMAIALIIGGTSCRSSRQVSRPSTETTVEQKQLDGRMKEVISQTSKLDSWQRMRVPVKVGGVGLPLSGYAYFENGKSVYISIRFLGAEVAFASVTTDSVVVVDKAHNRYLAEPLAALRSSVPVNIENVTDLLLGSPFILGETQLKASDARKFTLTPAPGGATAWLATPPDVMNCSYTFEFSAASDLLLKTTAVAGSRTVSATYSDRWESARNLPFAQRIDLSLPTGGSSAFTANLRYDFAKAKWDNDVTMPQPRIPSGAKSISAQSLLNMLKSM